MSVPTKSDGPILRVARITIEASAPLAIASGLPSLEHDLVLSRDANGLPILPATALAGVLRRQLSIEDARELFGDLSNTKNPKPGSLQISDGLAVASTGKVLDGLAIDPASQALLKGDDLFKLLSDPQPVQRDHVRLNDFGAVDGDGKFTRAAVPRGTRFLASIEMWDEAEESPSWRQFVEMLASGNLNIRMGSATRAGYGLTAINSVEEKHFDMRSPADREAAHNAARLSAPLGGAIKSIGANSDSAAFVLSLLPKSAFRFGQGVPSKDDAEPADLRPLRETVIDWTGNAATIKTDQLFIPASAIKGALRHRTVFHLRCLKGAFFGGDLSLDANESLTGLFGAAKDGADEVSESGMAGRVFIDDIPCSSAKTRVLTRTGIDRFSGGVRRGALFTEERIESGDAVELTISVDNWSTVDADLQAAFELALGDLAHGWLQLGAGGTKGQGIFGAGDALDPRIAARHAERISV